MDETASGRISSRLAWGTTAILFAVWTIAFIDRFILLLLVSGMKASLHISDTQIALLHGPAFSVVFAVAGFLMGGLIDATNRRDLILAGLIGWTLAAVACGLAGSFTALFLARMAIGICQAVLAPASFSLLADLFPVERRGKPISILTSAAAIGSALAQILGGILLGAFVTRPPLVVPIVGALLPWQSTMFVTALPGFLFALLFLFVREPARATSAAGAPSDTFALAPYLRRRAGLFGLIFAAFGAQFIVGYGVASWFAVLVMRTSGLAPAQTGLVMGGLTLGCGVASGLLGGWLSDRAARADASVGRFKLVIGCLIVEMLAFVPLFAAHFLPALIAGFIVYAVSGTMVAAFSYTIMPELVPSVGRGRILALHQLVAILLGLGAGPTLIALFTDRVFHDDAMINYSIICVAMPCAALAAMLLTIALPRARRLREALESGAEG